MLLNAATHPALKEAEALLVTATGPKGRGILERLLKEASYPGLSLASTGQALLQGYFFFPLKTPRGPTEPSNQCRYLSRFPFIL